jgi:TetR/AcrR family transcriptional repressor of nem operon
MAASRARGETDTQTRILDVAERLVQTRGFNAFSYADVAAELRITKPALHYHFPGKAELGEALLTRYATRFKQALDRIDRTITTGARHKLEAYAELYAQVLAQNRMCLCGMLAGDYHTLPGPMRQAIIGFFDDNEIWLASVLDDGQRDRTLRFTGTSRDAARMIIDTLEGAMLVARTYGEATRFSSAASRLLADFAAPDIPTV